MPRATKMLLFLYSLNQEPIRRVSLGTDASELKGRKEISHYLLNSRFTYERQIFKASRIKFAKKKLGSRRPRETHQNPTYPHPPCASIHSAATVQKHTACTLPGSGQISMKKLKESLSSGNFHH